MADNDGMLSTAKAANESKPIKITLPDGKVVEGESWKTSPFDIAQGISQGVLNLRTASDCNPMGWNRVSSR